MSSVPMTVYVVDDDPHVCRALGRLLSSAGHRALCFVTAAEFLAAHDPDCSGCVILDVALPGCGGLQVQSLLKDAGIDRPIIFLSGCASIRMSVQAMRAGAVTFLTKPVREGELLSAVTEALTLDAGWRRTRAARTVAKERLALLTPREREVFDQLLQGRLNKQIAAQLGTVEQTVKVHRARVMKKMGVRSVAALVRFAVSVEPTPAAGSLAPQSSHHPDGRVG